MINLPRYHHFLGNDPWEHPLPKHTGKINSSTIEAQVLAQVSSNARIPSIDIADQLGITVDEVETILRKLEENGVIIQYTTVVDEKKMPERSSKIKALIEVSVRPEKRTGFESIAKKISQFSNVVDHYLMSGGYDFLVIVEGNSLEEISSFVSDKLASIDNVRSTATRFIMKRYKEKGTIIGRKSTEERLAVSP
ncbi:Lrp/AsnC family transcriptional regulator [bacterium]|nr:Lrp/AsnC family transcriptional regulator [bacterium]